MQRPLAPGDIARRRRYHPPMFVFFSNRLGCLGSIAASVIGTLVLIFLMYSCSAGV